MGALFASDVLALLLAVVSAWMVGGPLLGFGPGFEELTTLLPLIGLLPVTFYLWGLYPSAGVGGVEELRRIVLSTTLLVVVIALFHLLTWPTSVSWLIALSVFMVTFAFLAPFGRGATRLLFSRRDWWGKPVVVLGAGRTGQLVVTRLQTHRELDLNVIGWLDDDARKVGTNIGGITVSGPLADAKYYKSELGVDHAIVAMPGLEPQASAKLAHSLSTLFASVVVIPNNFGLTTVGTSTRDSGGVLGIHVYGHLSLRRNRILKRVGDLVMFLPLSIVALPVIILSALAIIVVSPGNPFYRQAREGYRGRPVRIWKLRTMRLNADEALRKHLEENPDARAEWDRHFKLTQDPRIIPVIGRFLRRSSLDELPQILNVLVGELSFVGPRPFPYYHLEQFDDEFRNLRSSVVPGITGHWQVTSRSTADLVAQVELDTYYIRNWSPWLDLYILGRTPWAVLFGEGAY